MSKKLLAASAASLSLLAFVPAVFAFGGFGGPGQQNEAIQDALADGDYTAFQEAVAEEDLNRFENISEEDFEEMSERYADMEERRAEQEEYREQVQAAVEAGDYDEWKSLVEAQNPDAPALEKITAENFAQYQELHTLRKQAQGLADELGVGFGHGPEGMGQPGTGMKGPGGCGGGRHFKN